MSWTLPGPALAFECVQTQPLGMPASGRLRLGVNDTDFSDNSGFYSVTVTKQ